MMKDQTYATISPWVKFIKTSVLSINTYNRTMGKEDVINVLLKSKGYMNEWMALIVLITKLENTFVVNDKVDTIKFFRKNSEVTNNC